MDFGSEFATQPRHRNGLVRRPWCRSRAPSSLCGTPRSGGLLVELTVEGTPRPHASRHGLAWPGRAPDGAGGANELARCTSLIGCERLNVFNGTPSVGEDASGGFGVRACFPAQPG